MIKKLTSLFSVVVLSATIAVAQSFIASYTFDSVKTTSGLTDPSFVPTATGVTFGSFSATGTPANPNASGRFSYTNWPLGASPNNNVYTSLTGALSATEYYSVTLTPASGFSMSLTGMTFKSQRSGTGIRTYSVRSSADTYAANLAATIYPANQNLSVQTGNVFFWNYDSISSNQTGNAITLSGGSFTNVTSPVTFRFYAWNAEGTGGTFGIDTVKFIGSVTGATSIADFYGADAVSVYPNPSTDGLFTVDLGNYSGNTNITVYNIIGKIVFTNVLNAGSKQAIDLSDLANGSYFVNIRNDKESCTKKITVNK